MKTTAALALFLLLAAPVAAQKRIGSIYNPDRGPGAFIADKTARRPGDLVTILVSENQGISQQESADTKKESSLDFELNSLNLFPNAFNPLPDIGSSKAAEFKGSGNYSKSSQFDARVTVIVLDSLPNGNLVVSGRREIRVDGETKLIEVNGIVRRFDVRADNTVLSENVANATITYKGHGPLTNATNRRGFGGVVYDALDWLWPL